MSKATQPLRAFRFHGRSFLALVLKPEPPTSRWLAEADKWISRSPGFFTGKSVVIDVAGLSLTKRKFARLIADLKARDISILGVEGADPSWLEDGLPPLLTRAAASAPPDAVEAPASPTPSPAVSPPAPSSMLIEGPVRSGQSILFPSGDITVVGSVASGAELVAAGSIHVYGTLRGRAIAGAYENASARIFCRHLEAELLAINGYYSTAEDLEPQLRKKPMQAWLEDEAVKLAALD
jgi:septum site-determining protein MinC